MACVLVLYPAQFAAWTKFVRKLTRILSRLERFDVVYLDDPNGFIHDYFAKDDRVHRIDATPDIEQAPVSHAVIFDDGEEFSALRTSLHERKVEVRWVKIKITRVVNLRHEAGFQGLESTDTYAYIGRGSYWGNPYSMHETDESREEVIRKYRYDFEHRKFIKIDPNRVHELAGKRLGCFCKPAPCHGDVLADFLNRHDDGE